MHRTHYLHLFHRLSFGRCIRDRVRVRQSISITGNVADLDCARRSLLLGRARLSGGDNIRRRCGFLIGRSIGSLFGTGHRRRRRVAIELASPPPTLPAEEWSSRALAACWVVPHVEAISITSARAVSKLPHRA